VDVHALEWAGDEDAHPQSFSSSSHEQRPETSQLV